MDGAVTYRVFVGQREFDVTIAPSGDAVAVEVGPSGEAPHPAGGSPLDGSARAAEVPAPDSAEGAGSLRWQARWRRRADHAYTLELAASHAPPVDGLQGGAGRWVREALVAAAAGGTAGTEDPSAGTAYWVAVDGYQAEVRLVEARTLRLAAALPRRAGAATRLEVRAPMPGRVVSLRVAVGAVVQRGDLVATLEAMKMENELRAPGDGRVQAIHAGEGDTLEHGALILVLAPPEAAGDAEQGSDDPG
ncbi:MAG TPA: acetyl-CoA carboxylase biotin carboxyl carrier protein subunit [Chloroflexota bacterium]|nr:acetyl-CoA carboxylase biotin carboxyl carrier protein subunit [Chloroflexota bacterium]